MTDEELNPQEIFWRDLYPFLLDHGYQLRPRFRPGWIPSWRGTNKSSMFFEDSHVLPHPKTIDAVRLSDNKEVFIKRVEKASSEVDINIYLNNPSLRSDPSNHAVPVLDILIGNDTYDFLVMPVLRFFNDPPFVFVDEVLDFIQQTLEGLVFLHRVGVAHRDCSDLNLMFDATALFPTGFHPSEQQVERSGYGLIRNILNRSDVLSAMRYYFTDFGISTYFKDASQPRLVTGNHGQDTELPELSDTVPYDPFQSDIFILGNVYKTCLIDVYSNLSFLEPLSHEMTKPAPRSRPTAEESLAAFHDIVQEQNRISLRWMLLESNITRSVRLKRHLHSMRREISRFAKRIFGFPTGLILLASVTVASFVYGPRNIISRISDTFRRRP
ncbi:hypothetical protein SCHPADRAFT_944281 [Schizopora paradoxa]|uniref:Protein kinase domain-containing protein n=1 Tax=Schizopora paradoxa TaxID=27342 RepID=A0A0H2R9V2_9AGAM|nr:hypothetical protein SCHPADRAFT_944281 [Schizopora paradoxa]